MVASNTRIGFLWSSWSVLSAIRTRLLILQAEEQNRVGCNQWTICSVDRSQSWDPPYRHSWLICPGHCGATSHLKLAELESPVALWGRCSCKTHFLMMKDWAWDGFQVTNGYCLERSGDRIWTLTSEFSSFYDHCSALIAIPLVKNDCDPGQVICLALESSCDPCIRTDSLIILAQDSDTWVGV